MSRNTHMRRRLGRLETKAAPTPAIDAVDTAFPDVLRRLTTAELAALYARTLGDGGPLTDPELEALFQWVNDGSDAAGSVPTIRPDMSEHELTALYFQTLQEGQDGPGGRAGRHR